MVPDVGVALLMANLQGLEEAKILFNFCDNGAGTLGVCVAWTSSPHGTTSNRNFISPVLPFLRRKWSSFGHSSCCMASTTFFPVPRVCLSLSQNSWKVVLIQYVNLPKISETIFIF